MVFSLKNISNEVLLTSPIASNYNRIVLETKEGQVIEHYVWKKIVNPIEIFPNDTYSWKIDIEPILEFHNILNDVAYLFWEVNGKRSEKVLIQS